MFKFNTKTAVNKHFKLTDLFKQMNASKEAKKEALCIEKITLTNVLSPTTLNCEADAVIKEVYVFEITVNARFVPEVFIKELDNSIKFHTLFNIRHEDYELSMLSYKLGNYKGKYYQTNWENEDDIDLPLINKVPELYKYILSKFLIYPPFETEDVGDYLKRYNQLIKLDFQINKTQSAIAWES